ncbi:MAG: DUF5062 family protein [Cellvibrionaceae bacterium]
MNKLKNEPELVKEAIKVGSIYVERRGLGKVEATDSSSDKVEFIYRALVHDKLIQPLAKHQISEPAMKHKLALWMSRQLPEDHPLLQ